MGQSARTAIGGPVVSGQWSAFWRATWRFLWAWAMGSGRRLCLCVALPLWPFTACVHEAAHEQGPLLRAASHCTARCVHTSRLRARAEPQKSGPTGSCSVRVRGKGAPIGRPQTTANSWPAVCCTPPGAHSAHLPNLGPSWPIRPTWPSSPDGRLAVLVAGQLHTARSEIKCYTSTARRPASPPMARPTSLLLHDNTTSLRSGTNPTCGPPFVLPGLW